MNLHLKLQAPSLPALSWRGRMVAATAFLVVTLVVVWLTPINVGHIIIGFVMSALALVVVFIGCRIPWRRLRIGQHHDSVSPEIDSTGVLPPPYYSREELSPITIKYSGLSERELKKVLYDEHHHWVVTLAMIINPFWSRDRDIQPRVANTFVAARSGFGNRMLMSTIRRLTRLVQIFYVVLVVPLIIGLILRVMGVSLGRFGISDLLIAVNVILVIVTTLVWSRYMTGVAHGCRLVITEWSIILLVHQLPWRDNTRLVLQYGLYASSDPQQSPTGKLLGYTDLSISTTDPEEPLPGWIKARMPKKLKAVMAYWDLRKRNEQQNKYSEVARLGRETGLDDTQESPAMH